MVTKTLSLVLVSTATSRDWMRVDSAPATSSPKHGMRQWKPGWANFLNLPHCWITWMVPWGTQVQSWQDMAKGARKKFLRDGEGKAGKRASVSRAERKGCVIRTIRHRKRRGERRKNYVMRRKPRWSRGNARGRRGSERRRKTRRIRTDLLWGGCVRAKVARLGSVGQESRCSEKLSSNTCFPGMIARATRSNFARLAHFIFEVTTRVVLFPASSASVEEHGRHDERNGGEHLDEHVYARPRGILERIPHRVSRHRRLVRFGIFPPCAPVSTYFLALSHAPPRCSETAP